MHINTALAVFKECCLLATHASFGVGLSQRNFTSIFQQVTLKLLRTNDVNLKNALAINFIIRIFLLEFRPVTAWSSFLIGEICELQTHSVRTDNIFLFSYRSSRLQRQQHNWNHHEPDGWCEAR